MNFRVSAPANLLLLGEYAVLEEGGRGLALACSPRAFARVAASAEATITGRMGSSAFSWRLGSGRDAPPLVAAAFAEVGKHLAQAGLPAEPGGASIELDSSAFFAVDGNKRGLGSSAAVAVCLVAALLRVGGCSDAGIEESVFPLALAAHRRAQGGRGSGYDVAASRFGGLGIFVGGRVPSWIPRPDLQLPCLYLFAGKAPVPSADAVARYEAWRLREGEERRRHLAASAAALEAFLAASDPGGRLAAITQAGLAGALLGDAIGVPARLEAPSGLSAGFSIKALGAGDELGLLACENQDLIAQIDAGQAASLSRVEPEAGGLRWE